MQFSSTILFSVLATLAAAVPVEKRSSGPLKIDFKVKRVTEESEDVSHKHSRISGYSGLAMNRNAGYELKLENEYALYLADIEIGTPGQKVQIDIDTGSSDLWVPAYNSSSESSTGKFDDRKSSTFKIKESGFQIGYGDGSKASGVWATETVNVGGAVVKDLTFGYATTNTAKQSIMGVGLPGNEALAQTKHKEYSNFPMLLKEQGLVSKNTYSLYLNSLDAEAGSILFGAIDKAKYEDDLKYLDLVKIDDSGASTDEAVAFFVNLDKVENQEGVWANKPYPALLDSGTTLIYAPEEVAVAFGKKYGRKIPLQNMYITSCDTEGHDLEFTFEDKKITVPFKSLLYNMNGKKDGSNFLNQCLLGVVPTKANYYILGDSFLRSAYVHYDLDAKKLGVAQVKYTEESDIQVVN